MKMKSFALAVFLVGGSQLGCAGISAGFAAFANADYVNALKEFQPAAEKGDARAQVILGQMFRSGRGVPHDAVQAEKWFRLAAAQGNSVAQYEIGRDLVNGIDDREVEGVKLLQASAMQNNINAMEVLGSVYADERGGASRDANEALKWFSKAAARGSRHAQAEIALLSAKPGLEHGLALFNVASFAYAMSELKPWAEMGDSRAQYAVGAMYGMGEGMWLRENKELALKWVELSAAQNNADAQFWLAFNVEKDPSETLRLYRLSADQGNVDAMIRLGSTYEFGRYGVEKDLNIAMQWYIKAASTGCANQQFAVGDMYTEGKIVPVDLVEAAKWYEMAAKNGFLPALTKLGDIYAQGRGVAKDKALATKWYLKAIDSDSIEAQRGLAELLGE